MDALFGFEEGQAVEGNSARVLTMICGPNMLRSTPKGKDD